MALEETVKGEEEREIRNRSCSPLSQDFKSQDSGFSDSERSDCSEAYENATPRRKLRRRRMRRRIQPASPWLEEGSPAMPTHTSTPKDSRIFARNRFGKPARSPSRERRWANDCLTLINKKKQGLVNRARKDKEKAKRIANIFVLLRFKRRLARCWLRKYERLGLNQHVHSSSKSCIIDNDIDNF